MITYRVFHKEGRERVIEVINSVAAENAFLQTECYVPTLGWESLLESGEDREKGHLLLVVCDGERLVGFGRLLPDDFEGRSTGNVGIVLLSGYRYKRIGTELLELIVNLAPEFDYENLIADILFDNLVSLRLFSGHGFTRYSNRNLYLRHRNAVVEEVRMRLFLHKYQGKIQCSIIQQQKSQLTVKNSVS